MHLSLHAYTDVREPISLHRAVHILPWPKKLRQARKPNIGACMLDRSRACADVRAVVSIFLARVVGSPSHFRGVWADDAQIDLRHPYLPQKAREYLSSRQTN